MIKERNLVGAPVWETVAAEQAAEDRESDACVWFVANEAFHRGTGPLCTVPV